MHQFIDLLIFAAHKSKSAAPVTDAGGKSLSLSVGIVLFFVALGLVLTLSPPKRTYEVKRLKE